MDNLELSQTISTAEDIPTVGSIAAVGDFRSGQKRKRIDLSEERRNSHQPPPNAEDEAILSDVARVSLLEEKGMSVGAIAASLGLATTTVLTDLGIAAHICHPSSHT